MLTVLIVDDEYYFRESLKQIIDWQKIGYRICGEARNGYEALELIMEKRPDVVLLDINMPGLTGLLLAEKLKNEKIKSKIIIITGYSEFNYAKKAINLNVYSYLIKPVQEEELVTILKEIKTLKADEFTEEIDYSYIKNEGKINFLKKLLHGSIVSEEEYDKGIELYQCDLKGNYYQTFLIEIKRKQTKQWQSDQNLWYFAISNIIEEMIGGGEIDFEVFYYEERQHLVFLISAYLDIRILTVQLKKIIANVEEILGLNLTVSLGISVTTLFEISKSYNHALDALRKGQLFGFQPLNMGEDHISDSLSVYFGSDDRTVLLGYMRINDEKKVKELVKELFKSMTGNRINYDQYIGICLELYGACIEFMVSESVSITVEDRTAFKQRIDVCEDIGSSEEILIQLFHEVMKSNHDKRYNDYSDNVRRVLSYVESNYNDQNLTVKRIAEELYINYAHICSIFKKEYGVSISNHITEYRLKRAKVIFDEGNIVIQHVSKKVGFKDANYFSKCYKKFTGFTPSQYIEQLHKTK